MQHDKEFIIASPVMRSEKGMHKGLLVLCAVLMLVALFLTTFYLLPNLWNRSSYKDTSSQTQSEESETEHEVIQYVELEINSYQKSEKWMRDYTSDLPICESLVAYDVSNIGDAIAEEVQVTISIDGMLLNQFSLDSLSPSDSFADQFSVSIDYDDTKHVSLAASNQDSMDTDTLIISAVLPRSFNPEVAKHHAHMQLYITPNDPIIENTVDSIMEKKFLLYPGWMAIKDWVAGEIEYSYDRDSHGARDYWQLP